MIDYASATSTATESEAADGDEHTPDFERYAKVHAEALKRFAKCVEIEGAMRQKAEEDIRFRNGDQWPKDIKTKRGKDRPTITLNRTDAFIRRVVNEIRRSRPGVKVTPADSKASLKVAKVYGGLIRAIMRNSKAENAIDTAADQAVGSSFGHFRVCTRYTSPDGFTQDIEIERIPNQFCVYSDYDAKEADWSDGRFRFVTELLDPAAFKAEYGFTPKSFSELGGGKDLAHWFDGEKVRLAEYWRIVKQRKTLFLMPDGMIVTGDGPGAQGVLAQLAEQRIYPRRREVEMPVVEQYMLTGEGAFKKADYLGKYIPVISIVGREYWLDGKRHLKSLGRDVMDAQRMYNYWASKETEQVALQTNIPFLAPKGSLDDPEIRRKWNVSNVDPQPYLEYEAVNGMRPERVEGPTMSSGAREGRIMAIEDMKAILDMQDPTMGRPITGDASGVAVNAYREQGDTATFDFNDNVGKAVCQLGRVLVDLIRVTWDGPRIARMLGEDGAVSMVPVNQETVVNGINEIYDLRVGEYDVAVEMGPSYATQRKEALDGQLKALEKLPMLWQVIGDLVAKNTDWPQAEEIAARIKRTIDPSVLGEGLPPAVQQQMQQGMQRIQYLEGELQKAHRHITEQQFDVQKHAIDAKAKEISAGATSAKAQVDLAQVDLERQRLAVDTVKTKTEAALDLMELRIKEMQVVAEAMGAAVDMTQLQLNMQQLRASVESIAAPASMAMPAGAMMQ
ncbi:MAG: hypothetical protein IT493_12005 [Gammaproteobacteria bacterium]|nr:hypothetical protein [Gammaproteobacteria bacterium]